MTTFESLADLAQPIGVTARIRLHNGRNYTVKLTATQGTIYEQLQATLTHEDQDRFLVGEISSITLTITQVQLLKHVRFTIEETR